MKKLLSIILLICVVFSFTGCMKRYEPYESYVVDRCLCDSSPRIEWNYHWEEISKKRFPKKLITYNDTTFFADFSECIRVGSVNTAVSYTANDVTYYLDTNRGEVVGIKTKTDNEAHRPGEVVSEVYAQAIAVTCLSEYTENYKEYEVLTVFSPKTEFTSADVPYYIFEMQRKIQGYPTNEEIIMYVDMLGNCFSYKVIGTKEFDAFDIEIDADKLAESIEQKLRSAYENTGFTYSSHTVKSQTLCVTSNGYYGILSRIEDITVNSATNDDKNHSVSIFTVLGEVKGG